LARYEDFFANPAAIRLPMTELVFDRAANLRAVHGLKTPDALHLSAAIEGGCDEFWTTDERLDKAARESLRVMVF
jgi:predicted nucleic acid-binding protein